MDQKTPVPSVAFDPNQHVIAGRQLADGRQLFFSLSSIIAAEKGIEQGPVHDVTQADLERIERKVLAAVQAAVPPPQFPVDIMTTLAEMAGTIVSLTERIRMLEESSEIHTKNFTTFTKLMRRGG